MNKIKLLLVLSICLLFFGCSNVNNTYNSSIGQDALVNYNYNLAQANNSALTFYIDSTLNTDTSKKKRLERNGYLITETISFDTVVSKRVEEYKIEISEKRKDKFLKSLLKDSTITDEQRERKIESFVKKTHRKRWVYDTLISSNILYDSIKIVPPSTTSHSIKKFKISELSETEIGSFSKKQLLEQINILLVRIDSLKNPEKFTLRHEINDDTSTNQNSPGVLNQQELYDTGYNMGLKDFKSGIGFIFFSSILGFLAYFLMKPKINWDEIKSNYSKESSFRNGYEKGAQKKKWGKFGFILLPIFSTILIIIASTYFIGYFGW